MQREEIPRGDADIGTRPCPQCILCGAFGERLYAEQPDRLFGTTGLWDSKRCPQPDCNLIWLDPMPLAENIIKAYSTYYTHAPVVTHNDSLAFFKRVRKNTDENFRRARFGYPKNTGHLGFGLPGWWRYFTPLRRRNLEVGWRFLQWMPGGRVLDVGCGAGEWLSWMRELGWDVQGLDFDPGAVRSAQTKDLRVACGSVEDQNYPATSFDAVTLNHVIEHLPDPVGTLKECARLLKPGGKLVVVTPNGVSLAHRHFKEYWRGLETPRHLHIFSPGSMSKAL